MSITDLVAVHRRDGLVAALGGRPLSACPWKPGTAGGEAWRRGWEAGRKERPRAVLLRLATLLAVVLRPRREARS